MSASKRESLLSRRQWVAIWVIVGVLTLWIGTYLGFRVVGSRPDSIHPWLLIQMEPPADELVWHRYAPDFPANSLVKSRRDSSIAVPENTLAWSVVFHPLQQAEFLITGRRVYFIDQETSAATGRIHIGPTADF